MAEGGPGPLLVLGWAPAMRMKELDTQELLEGLNQAQREAVTIASCSFLTGAGLWQKHGTGALRRL